MRRIIVLLLVAGAGCSPSATPSAEPGRENPPASEAPAVGDRSDHEYGDWKRYAPAEAGFEAWFPEPPVIKPASAATGNFHVAGLLRRTAGGVVFTCQWIVREKSFSGEAAAAYLQGQQLGAVKSANGRLVEEREIVLDGVPGREFVIETADGRLLRCRAYLAGKRLITLQVLGTGTQAIRSAEVVKFLDSLTISK
ncbi:MAG: hypothetical protein JXP34_16795 [Planctomycetes bacterium]|nr:hypothetical protein [Planctomycetota bacterium]